MLAHCQACTAVQVLMLNLYVPLSQSAAPQIAKNNVKAASEEQMQLQGFMIGAANVLPPHPAFSLSYSACGDAGHALLLLQSEGWQQTAQLPSW